MRPNAPGEHEDERHHNRIPDDAVRKPVIDAERRRVEKDGAART
jgi:hypothetical protein